MSTFFDFTYNLNTQEAENEVLNALGKDRVKPFEPKSYFFTESSLEEQTLIEGAYGPENGNSTTRFNITTQLNLTDKKAYAVTSGQVLIFPQNGNEDKVNVFIKPLKNIDIGVPIKYFVYRGLKKEFFIDENNNILEHNEQANTPFMNKVWQDLINFNELSPSNLPDVPARLFGFNETDAPETRVDFKFFNVYDEETTNENKIYNLPIIEAGQHFGEFADDEGGFEIVLNNGFYYQEKSDTGFEFDLNYARAVKVVLDIEDIEDNPDISEKIYRENVQSFLDPVAFYGAHITEKNNGEVKVVDTSQKLKTKEEIYTNIVSKLYNKHKFYLYIQENRGRSFNFDGLLETDPIKIGISGNVLPSVYETHGWPIIITEIEQTHTNDESDEKKAINNLTFQLKFKTTGKKAMFYNTYGNCANAEIKGNFLESDSLVDEENIATQEYTNNVNYNIANTYGIGGNNNLTTKNIASFVSLNYEERQVRYFNNSFGPIDITPIDKVQEGLPQPIAKKVSQTTSHLNQNDGSTLGLEGVLKGALILTGGSNGSTPPPEDDDRTRLYVLQKTDAVNSKDKRYSQYLFPDAGYNFALTNEEYNEYIYGSSDYTVWKGKIEDGTEIIDTLQLINIRLDVEVKNFMQLGLTEVDFNKLIYNSEEVVPNSNHIPTNGTKLFFNLDDTGITQNSIYRKYKLGVKCQIYNLLGYWEFIAYPTIEDVFVYTVDGYYFFTKGYSAKYNFAEEFGKATMNFRPMDSYQGEFGFDWLRIGDNGEPSYESTIISGYEERSWTGFDWNTKFDSPEEAFLALKNEYTYIKTQQPSEIYYVPYLNIYPETTELDLAPSFAELKVKLKIHEDLSSINFFYDEDLFFVSDIPNNLDLTQGATNPDFSVFIICKKEFEEDQLITVIAKSQNTNILTPSKSESIIGVIKVCKNSYQNRKDLKTVLVKVRTNIHDMVGNEEKGKFDDADFSGETEYLKKVLFQSYINAEIEGPIELDLREEEVLQVGGDYMDGTYIKAVVDPFNILNPFNNIVNDTKQDFLKEKLYQKVDPKYKNYFVVFSFDLPARIDNNAIAGNVQEIGKHSVCLYRGRNNNRTLPHEVCHGLGLFHTHIDGSIKDPRQKYVFPKGNSNNPLPQATNNIMSYNGGDRKSTWRWQWQIMKKNLNKN